MEISGWTESYDVALMVKAINKKYLVIQTKPGVTFKPIIAWNITSERISEVFVLLKREHETEQTRQQRSQERSMFCVCDARCWWLIGAAAREPENNKAESFRGHLVNIPPSFTSSIPLLLLSLFCLIPLLLSNIFYFTFSCSQSFLSFQSSVFKPSVSTLRFNLNLWTTGCRFKQLLLKTHRIH